MAKKTFNIGDRVGQSDYYDGEEVYYNPDDEIRYGLITEVFPNGKVTVRFDGSKSDTTEGIDTQYLFHEADLKEKLSVLEAAFKQVEKDVKEKMSIAAAAFNDARKIAENGGFEFRQLPDALAPFESVLSDYGWSTSSFHC